MFHLISIARHMIGERLNYQCACKGPSQGIIYNLDELKALYVSQMEFSGLLKRLVVMPCCGRYITYFTYNRSMDSKEKHPVELY